MCCALAHILACDPARCIEKFDPIHLACYVIGLSVAPALVMLAGCHVVINFKIGKPQLGCGHGLRWALLCFGFLFVKLYPPSTLRTGCFED